MMWGDFTLGNSDTPWWFWDTSSAGNNIGCDANQFNRPSYVYKIWSIKDWLHAVGQDREDSYASKTTDKSGNGSNGALGHSLGLQFDASSWQNNCSKILFLTLLMHAIWISQVIPEQVVACPTHCPASHLSGALVIGDKSPLGCIALGASIVAWRLLKGLSVAVPTGSSVTVWPICVRVAPSLTGLTRIHSRRKRKMPARAARQSASFQSGQGQAS